MIATRLTEIFGLRHPLVLAPMAGVAGGRLAAAVTNAGGLGLVGGGYGDLDWLRRELALVTKEARGPWGAGLITWAADMEKVEMVLGFHPAAILLSFGDPRPYATAIKAAGCRLVCQVQTVTAATLAKEAGADLVVAQGTEAGGHGGNRAGLPLIPAIVDAVAPIPVVAAGGIADGRGLAAALVLGAQGAMLGTRFYASSEALGRDDAKTCIVEARGDHTRRTHVFDVVRGYDWPDGFTGRALRNRFMERWDGREADLAAAPGERDAFREAVKAGDYDTAMIWASEGVDLIDDIATAAALVARISLQAEAILREGAARLQRG